MLKSFVFKQFFQNQLIRITYIILINIRENIQFIYADSPLKRVEECSLIDFRIGPNWGYLFTRAFRPGICQSQVKLFRYQHTRFHIFLENCLQLFNHMHKTFLHQKEYYKKQVIRDSIKSIDKILFISTLFERQVPFDQRFHSYWPLRSHISNHDLLEKIQHQFISSTLNTIVSCAYISYFIIFVVDFFAL